MKSHHRNKMKDEEIQNKMFWNPNNVNLPVWEHCGVSRGSSSVDLQNTEGLELPNSFTDDEFPSRNFLFRLA